MGCYIEFNGFTKKWEIKGCCFVWKYETESEARADYSRAVAYHLEKLRAHNYVGVLLASCRNCIRREA